jgi:hypothetical protein
VRRDLGGAQADHGRAARRVLVLHLQVQGVRRSEGADVTIFRRAPVVVEHTVPPPDIVDTDEATLLEQQARLRHAHRLIDRTLTAQRLLEWEDRNTELENLCLDLRSTLWPSAPDIPGRS